MSAYISLNSLFLVTFFLASLRASAQLQDPTYVGHVCYNRISKNTSDNSNVGSLLISLSSSNSFFSNGSHSLAEGHNADKVFGIFLCKGDISPEVCGDCVKFASKAALKQCPGGKEFLIQYDECMLGYSDRDIFMDTVTGATTKLITWNPQTITANQDRFNDAVFALMNKSAEEAANRKTKKFAVNKSDFTSSQTIYASVQCNPVLTSEDCLSCLQLSIKDLNFNRVGGRILVPSCNSRYEIYPFYNDVPPPPASTPLPHDLCYLSYE